MPLVTKLEENKQEPEKADTEIETIKDTEKKVPKKNSLLNQNVKNLPDGQEITISIFVPKENVAPRINSKNINTMSSEEYAKQVISGL